MRANRAKSKLTLFLALIFVLGGFMSCLKKEASESNAHNDKTADAQNQLATADDMKDATTSLKMKSEDDEVSFKYVRSLGSSGEYTEAVKNLTQDYLLGTWSIEVISEELNYVRYAFDKNGTYYVFSPYGGFMGQHGKYELDGNRVTLYYPSDVGNRWDDLIFPDGKSTTLIYDYDFADFYEKGVLRNDNVILRKGVEKTPARSTCILKGIEVIKTEPAKVVATDNLKIRHEPSLNGKEGRFWYNMFLAIKLQDLLDLNSYSVINDSIVLNLLLKGITTSYDARTLSEDTIDGITAPWYRISLYEEGMPLNFWVFGGYLEPYEEEKDGEYKKQLFDAALERKLLAFDDDKYFEWYYDTVIHKVSEIVRDSAGIINKNAA